jgi:hypothetical protein
MSSLRSDGLTARRPNTSDHDCSLNAHYGRLRFSSATLAELARLPRWHLWILAAEQLAEADPAGLASGRACPACRRAVE